MQTQETRALSGVPGLMQIPILKRLFSSETVEKNESELLIALLPHIVRTPGITDLNLKTVASGTDAGVKVSLAPREPAPPPPPEAKPPAALAPAAKPATPSPQVPPQPAPPVTPTPQPAVLPPPAPPPPKVGDTIK